MVVGSLGTSGVVIGGVFEVLGSIAGRQVIGMVKKMGK